MVYQTEKGSMVTMPTVSGDSSIKSLAHISVTNETHNHSNTLFTPLFVTIMFKAIIVLKVKLKAELLTRLSQSGDKPL